MLVTVRLFARLREIAGTPDVRLDVFHGATVRDVWLELVRQYPEMSSYTTTVSSAVNEDYSRMNATLREGDEVAFLPPVSGGA